MTDLRRTIAAAVLCMLPWLALAEGAGDAAATDAAVEFSAAEVRLWMTDQLETVERPMTLIYTFERSGSLGSAFTDEVKFFIERINDDGTKAASVEFFEGERNFPVPPVTSTTTNPVLKIYLQGDVYEMNRLTDPERSARERWRYFQRRIKLALAETATVTPHTFTFDGRAWAGHEIRFEPYRDDPRRAQYESLADKIYSVIVSEDLPGYIYRIETRIPGPDGAPEPLVHEVLELSRIEPAT